MGEQTLISVSCTLPAEVIPLIEEKAKAVEMSRSEYLRSLILSGLSKPVDEAETPISKDPIILLQHILYGVQRVHTALYAMAETSGALVPDQLQAISDDSARRSLEFLGDLDEAIAAVRRQLITAAPVATGK